MLQQATGELPLGDYDRRVLTWVSSWSTGRGRRPSASLLTRTSTTGARPRRRRPGRPHEHDQHDRPHRARRQAGGAGNDPRRSPIVITFPLFLLLAGITAVLLKTRSVQLGAVVLGVLLGLSLASTTIGPPILAAVTGMSTAVVSGLSSVGGA